MVDTKPLLKGFGAAADVAGQIATDKAVNSRRTRSSFTQFDITNGQLLVGNLIDWYTKTIEHGLGRVPNGGMIVGADGLGEIEFKRGTATTTTFDVISTAIGITVDIWVF